MKFILKSIVFYVCAAICALTITGFVNLAIYWYFAIAWLFEFGSMLLFRIGLAITETSLCVYCVSQISEDVLYGCDEYNEYNETALTTDEEKETW